MSTQASIDAEINAQLPSGSNITASVLRQVLHDMNAAVFQSIPPTTTPSVGSILSATTASTTVWTPTPSLGVNGGLGGAITFNGSTSGSIALVPTTTGSSLNINQSVYGPLVTFTGPNAIIANQISITAAITGVDPIVKAIGTDANVNLELQGQGGSGAVELLAPSGAISATVLNGVQIGSPTGGDKGAGTLNVATGIYINAASAEVAQRVNGTVGVTGTTTYGLSIPTGATVTEVTAYTTTAFGATGGVTLSGGTVATDTTYFSATTITTLGVHSINITGAGQSSMPAGSPNYFLTLTQSGTLSNVGTALIVVNYLPA